MDQENLVEEQLAALRQQQVSPQKYKENEQRKTRNGHPVAAAARGEPPSLPRPRHSASIRSHVLGGLFGLSCGTFWCAFIRSRAGFFLPDRLPLAYWLVAGYLVGAMAYLSV